MMHPLKKIIENDDLDSFIKFLNENDIKINEEIVSEIQNYASRNIGSMKLEVSYDKCNCLKYAVHCQSDKIFNYLLSMRDIEINPNFENYGWPILAMATSRHKFDYSKKIIEHTNISLFYKAHTNTLFPSVLTNGYLNEGKKISDKVRKEHLVFVEHYLKAFKDYELPFIDNIFIYLAVEGEDYFELINKRLSKMNRNFLDLFTDNDDKAQIVDAVYSKHTNIDTSYLAKMLTEEHYNAMLEIFRGDKQNRLLSFFMAEDKKPHLFKRLVENAPNLVREIFLEDVVLFSYLNENEIKILEQQNITVWQESTKEKNRRDTGKRFKGIDFIVFSSDSEFSRREKKLRGYFIKNYLDKVLERAEETTKDIGNRIESLTQVADQTQLTAKENTDLANELEKVSVKLDKSVHKFNLKSIN